MLKLLGAVLLTGGGLTLGLKAVGGLVRRAEALSAFSAALGLLEGELALRSPPMPDLLDILARQAKPPAAEFFDVCGRGLAGLGESSFREIWARALESLEGALDREDRDILLELGPVLGRYDGEEQRRAVSGVRQRLAGQEKLVRDKLRREGRAYGTLGLTLGLFLTILLL